MMLSRGAVMGALTSLIFCSHRLGGSLRGCTLAWLSGAAVDPALYAAYLDPDAQPVSPTRAGAGERQRRAHLVRGMVGSGIRVCSSSPCHSSALWHRATYRGVGAGGGFGEKLGLQCTTVLSRIVGHLSGSENDCGKKNLRCMPPALFPFCCILALKPQTPLLQGQRQMLAKGRVCRSAHG